MPDTPNDVESDQNLRNQNTRPTGSMTHWCKILRMVFLKEEAEVATVVKKIEIQKAN